MKNYFAFKQNVAGDCGILKYEPPYPPASDILRLYLASEVDARIAELQEALHRFGIHPIECEAMRAGSDETQCDCGLYRLTRPL